MVSTKYIYVRWEDLSDDQSGWVCEHIDVVGTMVLCSYERGYPINVDKYGQNDLDKLLAKLREFFPKSEIIVI
jgi:hypothetical protein